MKSTTLAALLAAVVLPVAAQTPGTPSGIEKGHDKVQSMEDKAMADGKATPKERAKLEKAQNKQGKKIAKKKHNQRKVS